MTSLCKTLPGNENLRVRAGIKYVFVDVRNSGNVQQRRHSLPIGVASALYNTSNTKSFKAYLTFPCSDVESERLLFCPSCLPPWTQSPGRRLLPHLGWPAIYLTGPPPPQPTCQGSHPEYPRHVAHHSHDPPPPRGHQSPLPRGVV